jgi:carboxylesterase type B
VQQLRQVPADQLLQVYSEAFADYYHSPALDGTLIVHPTWTDIVSRGSSGHQLIIGTNADEYPDPQRTAKGYRCPTEATAAYATAAGGSAWVYFFTRIREGEGGKIVGAYHGAEYPYSFGTHDDYMPVTDIDQALTDAMMSYWASFATTGDPNSDLTPDWPQFSSPAFLVQELGDNVATIPAPDPELCNQFDAERSGQD